MTDLLTLATPEKPLILHVRGQDVDNGYGDTYSRCLAILRECLTQSDQLIHLHCFGGFKDQVRQWRDDFPNTHFGFAGNVKYFTKGQKEGLQEVPDHRILVETDSPYMQVDSAVVCQMPQYIGDVAALVADIRGQATDKLLKSCNRNFRKLYL